MYLLLHNSICWISIMYILTVDDYAAGSSVRCTFRCICCFQQLQMHLQMYLLQLQSYPQLLLLLPLGQLQLLLPLLMSWLNSLHAWGGADDALAACKIKFLNKFTNTGAVARLRQV